MAAFATTAALVVATFAAGAHASPGASPAAPAPPALVMVFDMPYGGCRLAVHADGSARLAYGAFPAWVSVHAGTFDVVALRAWLRRIAKPEELRYGAPGPVGMVTFEPGNENLWYDDATTALRHFRRAMQRRDPSALQPTPNGASHVLRACSRKAD